VAGLRLSILDQSPVPEGSTGADAIRNTLDLAELADSLGFHRYWLAEHHGPPMLASSSPEALIGPLAMRTGRIRLGSGGVMLPHYSPYKVAETFSVLAALAPGRVDLGLGRAPGTDPYTAFALQRDRRQAAPDDFPEQLAELLAYLGDGLPEGHPFARLAALPGDPERPEPWLLGSSPQSAIWAAELGLPYSFADFINPDGAAIAATYRERFQPSRWGAEPRVTVGVLAVCAETGEEAQRLAASGRMLHRMLRAGRPIQVPPPEKALRFLESQGAGTATPGRRGVVGGPEEVRAGIEAVAEAYGADEILVLTITHDHGARRRSHELLAEALGIGAAQEIGPAETTPIAPTCPGSVGCSPQDGEREEPKPMDPQRLHEISLFKNFPLSDIEEISPFADEVSVPEGKVLVREGDYSYQFMAIEEGTCEVTRDGGHVADLGPGDFFGELGLLEKSLRTATVTAKTPMRLITLDGWDMKRVERAMPGAIERLRDIVEERRPPGS